MERHWRISRTSSFWEARDGIAAVEFAMLAPVLLLIFAGAVSLGLASWTKMQLGNAARAGAAYAIKYGYNSSGITSAAQNATTLTGVTVTPTQAPNSCTDPSSGKILDANGATTCPGTGSPPGTYVIVATKMAYAFVLPITGITGPTTLSGNAVARIK